MQCSQDDCRQRRWNFRGDGPWIRRGDGEMRKAHSFSRCTGGIFRAFFCTGKRTPAGEQLVQQNPQGVDISGSADRLAANLFWRHIGRRPCCANGSGGALRMPRHAEIGQVNLAGAVDHHIARFDITVHNPIGMGISQGGRKGFKHAEDLSQRQLFLLLP